MSADKLKIALVTPEFFPLAKTGGLADVTSALAKSLSQQGHTVKVFLPNYQVVQKSARVTSVPVEPIQIRIGDKTVTARLKSTTVPGTPEEIYLVDCPQYFDRLELAVDKKTGLPYADNDERFILYSRAVLEFLKKLNFQPDVIHAHEWQAALVCAYLKVWYGGETFFKSTGSFLSLHNLALQGIFPKNSYLKLGLGENHLEEFEFHGKINFLKAGICHANILNTVSETYAVEIQSTMEYGYGLEGVLRQRNNDLYGIVNGADYTEWSPVSDKFIPIRYDEKSLDKKRLNKQALLNECGWESSKIDWPALGMVSRLVEQKGVDLIAEIAEELLARKVMLILLGTGDKRFEQSLKELEKKYPEQMKVFIGFDERLAHLIEAGCDMYLMPSMFEPCGLNQLYSLKYGTVPVARATGGLVDTIEDFTGKNEGGTGFLFKGYNSEDFWEAIERALQVYQDKKVWEKLQQNGMRQDFSWEKAAERYVEVYRLARKG